MTSPQRGAGRLYEFGDFRLDPRERRLLRAGSIVTIKPKVFDLLVLLVENSGHVLAKAELMRQLWSDAFVEEHNLTVTVYELRKVLGEQDKSAEYVETVSRKGYRFVPIVRQVDTNSRASLQTNQTTTDENRAEHIPYTNQADHAAFSEGKRYAPYRLLTKVTLHPKTSIALALLLTALAAAAALISFRQRLDKRPQVPFKLGRVVRITTGGNITDATISRDGSYVAYLASSEGGQSLWIKHKPSSTDRQLIPPSDIQEWGVTLSPNAEYLYYLKPTKDNSHILCQIPTLGGRSREILTNVDSPISFSPDGSYFAFLRRKQPVTKIVIAKSDGSDETDIGTRTAPEFFPNNGPAWSPDGKLIACIVSRLNNGYQATVVGLRLDGGPEERIIPEPLTGIGSIAWLADGSGLMLTAVGGATTASQLSLRQIWYAPFPAGRLEMITSDSTDYPSVSLSGDSGTLIAEQKDILSTISIVFTDGKDRRLLSSGHYEGYHGLAWAPDGRIIYTSIVGDAQDIWIMDSNGGNKKRLTDTHSAISPAVSSNGTIAFTCFSSAIPHLCTMDIDGNNLLQLTNGSGEMLPSFTPDGQWVIFLALHGSKRTVARVSATGGEPEHLTTVTSRMPLVSPSGKEVAFYYRDEGVHSRWHLGVMKLVDRSIVSFDLPASIDPNSLIPPMRWAPDGRALTYVVSQGSVSNLWRFPLDRTQPTQITRFDEGEIFSYQWSSDAKTLLMSRGRRIGDIVLIDDSNR